MDPTPVKPESERRANILLAAHELLAERGNTSAISVQDIATRAGTTKVTLYRYFPSKEALFTAVAATLPDDVVIPDRRDGILDAALRLVPRYGLQGVTMERIAEEAGVSPATLYWHFKNKNDLLLAMMERIIAQIDFGSFFPTQPLTDADDFLRTMTPRILGLLDGPLTLLPIVLAEVTTHPELAPLLYQRVAGGIWAAATRFLDRQVEAGVFRPGHALLRMDALLGMFLMYSLMRRNFSALVDLPEPEAAAKELSDLFLHGVIAHPCGGRTDV